MNKIEIFYDDRIVSWYINNTMRKVILYYTCDYPEPSYYTIRKWLEENLENQVYLQVKETRYILYFEYKEDYIAFKLVFPRLC